MTDPLREQLPSTLAGAYAIERELGGRGMSRRCVAEASATGRTVLERFPLDPEQLHGWSSG